MRSGVIRDKYVAHKFVGCCKYKKNGQRDTRAFLDIKIPNAPKRMFRIVARAVFFISIFSIIPVIIFVGRPCYRVIRLAE